MSNNPKLQPMSAARGLDESTAHKLKYPLLCSVKLDGIRGIVQRDILTGKPIVLSKSFKPIRSAFVQEQFAKEEYMGFDGEFIFGSPTDPLVCNKTMTAVMTMGCRAPVDFYVFDKYSLDKEFFIDRYNSVRNKVMQYPNEYIKPVAQTVVLDWADIIHLETAALNQGYEGLILRNQEGPYKQGRSTLIEQYLVKLKRVSSSEATVIGFTELMLNQNEPVLDAMGYQKRSSSKEGKVPGNTLGTLILKDIITGVEFEVGSGFDDTARKTIWNNKEFFLGSIVTYYHFPIGQLNKPRQPIFKGFRHPEDMIANA